MSTEYPYQSGDHTIIGPECFTDADAKAIAYKGEWYFTHRTITKTEELDALPNDSVILAAGDAYQQGVGADGEVGWWFAGSEFHLTAATLIRAYQPVKVIWEPQATTENGGQR